MTRKLAMLATAAAIVAVPQIAQAGCNGPACSGFSSTANYSASDKRVRATVTNREQTPIHLKFCVNVDYHCNGFDVTIAPRETITKDVAFSGAKPPKIAAVDVVTAEFAGAHPAAAGGTAGVASVAVLANGHAKREVDLRCCEASNSYAIADKGSRIIQNCRFLISRGEGTCGKAGSVVGKAGFHEGCWQPSLQSHKQR